MKNVLLLSALLVFALVTKAQSNKTQGPIEVRTGCTAYYIDGIRVTNIYAATYAAYGISVYRIEGTTTINRQQLMNLPQRNVNAVAGTVAGVDSRNGEIPNIRGARQDGTAYYIDGIRIRELEMSSK